MMTYEEHWNELRDFLDKAHKEIGNMLKNCPSHHHKEKERLTNKLDGLNVALQHMRNTDKIYELRKGDDNQ